MRSRIFSAFVPAIVVIALVAVATLSTDGVRERPGTVLLLAGIAALAALRPVRIPSFDAEFTASHPLMLFALAAFGPMAAVLVALGEVVGATIGRRGRPDVKRLTFNLAAVTVSVVAAAWVFGSLGGSPGETLASLIIPLAAATVLYFGGNTGLVATVISLDTGRRLFPTWRRSFLWTAPSYLTGLVLAVAMLAVVDASLWLCLALCVPPCWLLIAFYRSYAASVGAKEVT